MEKYFDAHITISIPLECSAGWLSMRTCDVQLHLFAIHSSWQWRSMRAKLLTIPICKRASIIFFSLLFCIQFYFAQIEQDCVLPQVLMKLILCCVCFKFTVIQAPSWVSEQIFTMFTMLTVCNVPWTKNKAQWLLCYCCVCVQSRVHPDFLAGPRIHHCGYTQMYACSGWKIYIIQIQGWWLGCLTCIQIQLHLICICNTGDKYSGSLGDQTGWPACSGKGHITNEESRGWQLLDTQIYNCIQIQIQ